MLIFKASPLLKPFEGRGNLKFEKMKNDNSGISLNRATALGIIESAEMQCTELTEGAGELLTLCELARKYLRKHRCISQETISFIETMLSADETEFRKSYYYATKPQRHTLWLAFARRHNVPIKI